MNPGDSVQDASRSGLDEASGFSTAVGQGNGTPTRSPRTQKPLQDIQDLIEADVEPALVEDLRGRLQDALPVPLGVPSQRPDRVLGHWNLRKKVETTSPLYVTV